MERERVIESSSTREPGKNRRKLEEERVGDPPRSISFLFFFFPFFLLRRVFRGFLGARAKWVRYREQANKEERGEQPPIERSFLPSSAAFLLFPGSYIRRSTVSHEPNRTERKSPCREKEKGKEKKKKREKK